MNLQSCRKLEHGRCVPPEETVGRLEAMLSARRAYWIHQEQVHDLLHWSALFLDDDPAFRAMGKGVTAALSRAGALAEAAESLTALPVEALPGYRFAPEEEVENALTFAELLPHIASATPAVLARIRRLEAARHWARGVSLLDGREVMVPVEYVRQISGPSGRASGNRIEEAVVHAAAEIFERRAHVTVLRNRMVVPTIDPASLRHPVILRQLEFVRARGIEVVLKDLSFGGALPCVGAYFRDPAIPPDWQFHHFFKVGASFDREEALVRVLTEYTQGRRADDFIAGRPGEVERVLQADFRRLRTAGDDCDHFLTAFMFGMVPYRDASFLLEGDVVPFDPGIRHDDCLGDIADARAVCAKLGRDLIAVDFTDPAGGFPVVQLIIPGYSDVLPFHPPTSPVLFRPVTRAEAMEGFVHGGPKGKV